ncbi:hypothetical protein CYLTODRAFT_421619 [Cylindrobasidium torrendii FP15055 ss-10]|uniref:Fido domain-containing protein n=1 Tax=Cylindrobasidium torrendii FP15055 ss-10 TaxID=1314674 RepID=A0A0D7BDZ2_9AGAR|nr:hypothetical protein CYLTODRAFT_421619 [Cylindrobasidium torrendii FP15055 ss-10]
MSLSLPDLRSIVIGRLPTADPLRSLQLNEAVTYDSTPTERPCGFQRHCLSKIKAVLAVSEDRNLGDSAEGLLSISRGIMSVSQAIDIAVRIAIAIRTEQWFLNGNHRTALAALVFSLAEHGVILSSSFRAYHAYTILSARFHPGNESNSLNEAARADVTTRLKAYLHTRTYPITQSKILLNTHSRLSDYLLSHVLVIGGLSVTIERVEARMNELQALADKARWQERLEIWRSLDRRERTDLKLACYPYLDKGPLKLR